ncbi:protein broad-minded-like isoform X2 [Gigantopelta aegis]|uniref:protein broad-minded-like isoform X2 n=1 Tax=Gigantopelta aegis TaxID=1735272 RepID=UPI001B88BF13|nr:protein broad-minded-like isoform X2 [Gigantopelta aegis]
MSLRPGLEGEQLFRSLRQLVLSFEPHIRDAESLSQTEEALQHLEENDENFHKYEFVKELKHRIDELLGPLIDDEIERHSTTSHVATGSSDTLVGRITDQIIHSKQYSEFRGKLSKNIQEAMERLMENFERELSAGRQGDIGLHSRNKTMVVEDEEEGSVMLFDPEHMKQIADNLSKTKSLSFRRQALQNLNQIMSADFVNSNHWSILRENLHSVMCDPDEHLSNLSMKFIAKAFTSTSNQTREIFTLLSDFLADKFQDSSSHIPHLKQGLETTTPENTKLLKAFRLMNEFQQETQNYWIRYPDRYKLEILDSTLSLLSIHHSPGLGPSPRLTPLHFVALVDPKANWFIRWMHANYSRKALLQALEKYKSIVENAVKHCLDFSIARKNCFDMVSDVSDSFSKFSLASGDSKRTFYTGSELDYLYFVHSVCFLGRMLCFVNGRNFFPVKIKDSKETISVGRLLKALVLFIVDPSSTPQHIKPSSNMFDPATLVTDVLKGLCHSEQVCEISLCNDEFTNTLLTPVAQFYDYDEMEMSLPSEDTLLHVADILSLLASSTIGRRHLLYGERHDMFTRTKYSAAHIIAMFTKKSLISSSSASKCSQPSLTVIGAYLYICRQLYNTCEGLLVLYPYDLHVHIAKAGKEAAQASERAPTPTPSDTGSESKPPSVHIWEDNLRDNLLNFAGTPKGILLLQLTGEINECVVYMYTRYEKKLQVSKCEKFGYGVMVTQVAATAPGMVALQNTGYIKALLMELWTSLECGPSDDLIFTPRSWPVDTIERTSHKHLIRLLNILSAFPAVYEVLADKPLPVKESYGFRHVPDTIDGLLDRLTIVDTPEKIHSLFSYEQSHVFGLRVLSVMISCLDTFLLMQSQYKFQEVLLRAQAANKFDSDKIIVDMLSVERNYILVKTYLVGGPFERVVPPKSLPEGKVCSFPFPLFESYPLPREYSPNLAGRSTIKQAFVQTAEEIEDNELSKFLSQKVEKKASWIEKARGLYSKFLTTNPDQAKGTLLQQLLEQSVQALSQMPEDAIFPLLEFSENESSVKKFVLSPLQQLGIKVAVRYGIHLKVINTSAEATDSLSQLLKQTGCFLKQQHKAGRAKTTLRYTSGSYPGFDWFVATIFLLFNGNLNRTWKFLLKFSSLGTSGYLWMARLHASVHLPSAMMNSGIPPVFSSTAHYIEFILQTELPLVASAFKMSGYTPAQICVHWLKQCFWNYLDWMDISHYICTCVILGVDYQVYTCVAIFSHLQQDILRHMQTQDLLIFLKEETISKFHIADNLEFMKRLESKYRTIVLPDMLNITKP